MSIFSLLDPVCGSGIISLDPVPYHEPENGGSDADSDPDS